MFLVSNNSHIQSAVNFWNNIIFEMIQNSDPNKTHIHGKLFIYVIKICGELMNALWQVCFLVKEKTNLIPNHEKEQ